MGTRGWRWTLVGLVTIALCAACSGEGAAAGDAGGDIRASTDAGDRADAAETDAAESLTPIRSVATQNTGTSEFMSLYAADPIHAACAEWYENNLCALATEQALAARIAADRPDVLMLQEVWNQSNCATTGRPDELSLPPYVCAADARPQPERVLPADYHYGCAAGYPDNCVAYRPDTFVPTDAAACHGRDCSAAVISNQAPCGRDGRIAYLRGRSAHGPTVLVVVHTNAGIDADDLACRAAQLTALTDALASEAPETTFLIAGDFNFDPTTASAAERDALTTLMDQLALVRLADDGPTHRIIQQDLDLLLVSDHLANERETCHVTYVDEADPLPMLDHGYVFCP